MISCRCFRRNPQSFCFLQRLRTASSSGDTSMGGFHVLIMATSLEPCSSLPRGTGCTVVCGWHGRCSPAGGWIWTWHGTGSCQHGRASAHRVEAAAGRPLTPCLSHAAVDGGGRASRAQCGVVPVKLSWVAPSVAAHRKGTQRGAGRTWSTHSPRPLLGGSGTAGWEGLTPEP